MPDAAAGRPRRRREMRAAAGHCQTKDPLGYRLTRLLGRGSVLAVLAGLTIAAPMSGLLGPNMSIAVPSGQMIDAATAQPSLLELLDRHLNPDSGQTLAAVPAAASRARIRTAAAEGRCVSAGAGANGDIAGAYGDAKLLWPLVRGTYQETSPFGYRADPMVGGRGLHEGLDMAGPLGTPIMAAADGVVTDAGPMFGGYAIYIKHEIDGQTIYTGYLHMYGNGLFVSKGDQVKAGQHIADIGSSGWSTGPHLHFEVRLADKQPIDPKAWMVAHGVVFPAAQCE